MYNAYVIFENCQSYDLVFTGTLEECNEVVDWYYDHDDRTEGYRIDPAE